MMFNGANNRPKTFYLNAGFLSACAAVPLALIVCAVFAKTQSAMLAQPFFLSIDLRNAVVSINGMDNATRSVGHVGQGPKTTNTSESHLKAPTDLILVYLWTTCTGRYPNDDNDDTPLWKLAEDCTEVQYKTGYRYNFMEPVLEYMPKFSDLPDASDFESATDASALFVLLNMAFGFSLLGLLAEFVVGFFVTEKDKYWQPRALVHLLTFLSLFVGCCLSTYLMEQTANKINMAAEAVSKAPPPLHAEHGKLWLILMWCGAGTALLLSAYYWAPKSISCMKRRKAAKEQGELPKYEAEEGDGS